MSCKASLGVSCHLNKKNDSNWNDSDSWLAINKVNINFNNNTGICSSFSREQLHQCSVEAGSNQTFDEFRGYSFRGSPASVAETVVGSGNSNIVNLDPIMNKIEFINIIFNDIKSKLVKMNGYFTINE